MLDRFDRLLLNLAQRDSARTAESLSADVPLSPSAIARRLRRLRADGSIARTIGLLSPKIVANRLRAVVMIQLEDHSSIERILNWKQQLIDTPALQFFFETAGSNDFVLVFDCANMGEFNDIIHDLIIHNPTVHRHECHFIMHELKFAPFIDMAVDQRQ